MSYHAQSKLSKVEKIIELLEDGKNLAPRIKRLSEYLGQSYWQYLSELKDLVILMDEAHRYHADKSKEAINELKPVLGIELTATPIDEKGNQFRNVVYEYSLAKTKTVIQIRR
jgi:type III restriction enzyme